MNYSKQYSKKISMKLKPSKTSRTITFEVELYEVSNVIDFETLQKTTGYTLSICGAIRKGGVSCQMRDYIRGYRSRVRDEDLSTFNFLLEVWGKYHLNDLKAGTKVQEEALRNAGMYEHYDYTKACDYLKSIGLYEDRGYKYGHGWLFEPLPQEIADKIIALCA